MTADKKSYIAVKKAPGKYSLTDLPADHKYNGLDLVKFLCAFLICIIHIAPFSTDFSGAQRLNFWLQQGICRIAVPFYFTVSGFLVFKKIDLNAPDKKIIKGYVFRMFRLLGTWTFLLTVGWQGHLWYFGAVALAVTLLYMFLKCGIKMNSIVIISLVLYCVGLSSGTFSSFMMIIRQSSVVDFIAQKYEMVFQTTRNGLFFGLLYVFMGAWFAHKRVVLNNLMAACGLIISWGLVVAEVYWQHHYAPYVMSDILISLIPATFFLFYLASHIDLQDRLIYNKLRVWGMLIFCLHLYVGFFVDYCYSKIENHFSFDLSPFYFLIVMSLTAILAVAIERLSKKDKFKWLRYLYS